MTRTTRWFLGSAALALAALATPALATDAWAPPAFTSEAAELHWLDAGAGLATAPGDEATTRAPAGAAVQPEAVSAGDWKTNPSRYLGSPIYGRGVVSSE